MGEGGIVSTNRSSNTAIEGSTPHDQLKEKLYSLGGFCTTSGALTNKSWVDIYSIHGRIIVVQVYPPRRIYEVYVRLSEGFDEDVMAALDRYVAQPKEQLK